MSTFKEMVERDVKSVFQNTGEFAALSHVIYDGVAYDIPVVLDGLAEEARDAERKSSMIDHAPGIYMVDARLYIARCDMREIPEKGQRICVDGKDYLITKSSCEMGQIALGLEMLDE